MWQTISLQPLHILKKVALFALQQYFIWLHYSLFDPFQLLDIEVASYFEGLCNDFKECLFI